MTDHEKLRFHSRQSSEFLAAVPIKKRRFILPPSPPRESPTPILTDSSTSAKKSESSELEPPCSKTGRNPAEVNIVSGEEVARESHDPQLRTAGCALTEKKPKSSVPGSPFSGTVGTPAQVSLATDKGSSEPCELPSPAQTDSCIPEKKTASPFSRNGGNPIQANAVTGNNASCEHREWQATAAGCGISENKPESSELGSPFSKCGLNPPEVSTVTGQNASCEPCMIPSPTQADVISEKKPEPSKPVCLFPKTGGNAGSQVNSVTGRDSSHESRKVPMTRDLNICPKPEFLATSNDQVSGLNLATNSQDGTDKVQEMILNDKCAAWLVNGGNPVQVNAVTGNNASCEHSELQATAAGCGISEKKPESSELGSPFSKCGLNPAEVSAVTGQNASCEPCMIPSPTQADGISEKKPEPSKPVCPFPESGGNPGAQVTVTGKDYSHESRKVPMTRDLNICQKPEFLPTSNDQGSGLNLAANSQDGTDRVQEMILNGKCAAWLVSGSMVTPSAAKQTCVTRGMGGNGEGKLTPCKGIFVKQEASETTSSDTNLKTDSSRLSLNRSNWDLNTMMDAWGGSSADSLLNNGAADSGRKDLGGIQTKRFEVGPKLILFKEPNGTDVTLKNYELQKNLKNSMEPTSEACLDLQLNPSFLPKPCITTGKHAASKEIPFLTLGMKPVLSTCSKPLATGRTVKSELIESDQKDAGQVQLGVLKSQDLKHVKSEPCEGQQISKMTIPDNMNLACSGAIKPEPLDNQSLKCVRDPEGSSFHVGLKSHSLDLQSTLMHQDACEDNSKALDVASKPPDSSNMLHTCTDKYNTNILNDCSDMVDEDRDLVNQASILGNDKVITAITQSSNGIATEPSALGSESLVSDGNDMNSLPEACETSRLPEAPLSEPLASNVEGVSAKGAAELVVEMDASNTGRLPHVSLIYEVLRKPCGNSRIVEPDEVEGKAGVSSEVIDEPCDSTCRSGGSHVAAGTVNSVRRQCGKADDDYEDGEVRYPALNGAVEDSCVVTEEQGVKAANISPVDVPVSAELPVDEKETRVDSLNEGNALSSKEGDGHVLEKKVEPSSAVGALTADSGKRSLSKTIRRPPKDHLKNDKDLERKSKSRDLSSKTSPPDSQSGAASSEQQNAAGPCIAKKHVSSKTEPSEKVGATRDANDRGNRRIIYLNSASNCSESGKRKSTSDRLMSSQGEGERDVDRSFRRERSHSRGSRDESSNERSRKVGSPLYFRDESSNERSRKVGSPSYFRDESSDERPRKVESQRHHGHTVEKCRSDFMRIRSRADRLNALHVDRNANSEHLLGQINSSNGIRYSRPISAAEVAIGASPDGSKRATRKLTNEEMQNPSRFPCQRRSPGGRVQIPLGRHPIRDISPSRCIGRDVPDFALLAHEEKSRNFPEDMAEHSMFSHSHPRAQYERAEGIILHRERRSLSPPFRRGGPLQMPPNCQKSSPRSQQRPTHQWSPPRRTSDSFSGQRDLGRCRSPPLMMSNRMQSPHEQPCFSEEVIVRRRGGSPYIARLPADMVDVGPTREHDFPRLVRGPNRNMRRFNMIDPREMMEDEYFGPPLVRSQIREFDVGDEFVEERRCDERRGPIRPFRQRCVAGDNEGESFRFHDEDGPSRGLRLRPDAIEGFPEDGGPRDFDVHFRNRLGNPSGRLRGQEQEDNNYRHYGEQEWRDTAFNDGRPKRRRF